MAESDPCLCRNFHADCNPVTCSQAQHAGKGQFSESIREYRRSAVERRCATCATVVSAVMDVPAVRKVLQASIAETVKRSNVKQRAGLKTIPR